MSSFGPQLAQRCTPPGGKHNGDPRLPATRVYRLAPGEVTVDLTPLPVETSPCNPTSVLETGHDPGELQFWPTREDYRAPLRLQLLDVVLQMAPAAAFLLGQPRLAFVLIAAYILSLRIMAHVRKRQGFRLTRRWFVERYTGAAVSRWETGSVLAVQVIPGLWYESEGECFQAYQFNLVLAEGERVNVANSRQRDDVCGVAAAFAFYLDVPCLNEAPDSGFEHPWLLAEFHVPAQEFGPGSTREFREYFEGQLLFRLDDLADVESILKRCPYVSDQELYGQHDYWAHPCEFERLQRGDCEDRALWAWRHLVEMGYDARFMVGWWHVDARAEVHAWVYLFVRDEPYVLETVGSEGDEMLIPWAEAERSYQPRLSVDKNFRTARHQARRTPTRVPPRGGNAGSVWVERDLWPRT